MGISSVDDPVKALGADLWDQRESEVSRIWADRSGEVGALRDGPLAGRAYQYMCLKTTYREDQGAVKEVSKGSGGSLQA